MPPGGVRLGRGYCEDFRLLNFHQHFEGWIWVLIVSVPDLCIFPFYFHQSLANMLNFIDHPLCSSGIAKMTSWVLYRDFGLYKPTTHHLSWFCVIVSWVLKSSVVERRGFARILVNEGETSWVLESSVVESSWFCVDFARIPEQISY